MSDLDKLIAAVEAGNLPEAVFHGSKSVRGHWAYTIGLDAEQRRWAFLAYNGSLDAALRLHEALLPGWAWEGGSFSSAMSVYPPFYPGEDFDAPCYSGENANLPRALLLAILRALKAKGEP